MAGIDLQTSRKLKASSLLEVMVALVVIFTVFAISMGLYVNVSSSSVSLQETKAFSRLEKLAAETQKIQQFIDQNYQEESFNIVKTVKPFAESPDLISVTFKAVNAEDKVLAEIKEIMIMKK